MTNKKSSKQPKNKLKKVSTAKKTKKPASSDKFPFDDVEMDLDLDLEDPHNSFTSEEWLLLKQPIKDYCSKKDLNKTWEKLKEIFHKLESAIEQKNTKSKNKSKEALASFFNEKRKKLPKFIDELPNLLKTQLEAQATDANQRIKDLQKMKAIEVRADVKELFKAKYDKLKESKEFANQGEFVRYLLTLIEE